MILNEPFNDEKVLIQQIFKDLKLFFFLFYDHH